MGLIQACAQILQIFTTECLAMFFRKKSSAHPPFPIYWINVSNLESRDVWKYYVGNTKQFGYCNWMAACDGVCLANPSPVSGSSCGRKISHYLQYRVLYIPGGAGFLPSTVSWQSMADSPLIGLISWGGIGRVPLSFHENMLVKSWTRNVQVTNYLHVH